MKEKIRNLILSGAVATFGLGAEVLAFEIDGTKNETITIVTAENPAPAACLSARELRLFIKKMVPCQVVEINDKTTPKGKYISVGDTRFSREAKYDVKKLGLLEYVVDVNDSRVILVGLDDATTTNKRKHDYARINGIGQGEMMQFPGMYDHKETTRATYDFLEACGVRFYGPRPDNVVVPKVKKISIKNGVTKRAPWLEYNRGFVWDTPLNTMPYGYQNPGQIWDDKDLYNLRLRAGGKEWYINHTYQHLRYHLRFPKEEPKKRSKYFERVAPEFYPPKGSPSHQFCYTSEALADQVAKDARDYFDGKRFNNEKEWGLLPNSDFFPVVPLDCGNYCTCETCQKLLKEGEGKFIHGKFNDGRASKYVFNFANMVARRLKKTHPNKYIAVLAYENYYWLPENFTFETNVAVVPCIQVCAFWNKTYLEDDMKWYRAYAKLIKEGKMGPMYSWNYFHHPEEPGLMERYNVMPPMQGHLIDWTLKEFAKDGVMKGIFVCGGTGQPDHYFQQKLYDRPELNVDEMMEEYFSLYFGEAAKPMRQFYDILEDLTTNPEKHYDVRNMHSQKLYYGLMLTPERMLALQDCISRAKALVKKDSVFRRRIDSWDKGYMQYMWDGRGQYLQTPKRKALGNQFFIHNQNVQLD